MSSRRRPGAPCDFEEARPGRFIIHNPALGPTLRGEGEREGDRFTLTSARGEGLVGRLRARGFVVLTLHDQVADLPGLPAAAPPGDPLLRQIAAGEQISYFAADPPGWCPAPAEEKGQVHLRAGWVLRRRRARGPFSYYLLDGGAFSPRDEDGALLLGYAQAARVGPVSITPTAAEGGYRLPDLPLPAAHRRLLGRIAERTPEGWLLDEAGLSTAKDLFARLGLTLQTT